MGDKRKMTEKLRELLEDVQTVYEGKGMVVHPNSFDRLRMEVIKLDNINKQQSEQIEKMKCYLPVDERDSDHKWFAYKNLFDTEWKIDYSVQGELPKCNTIKWFENKEAVMFYLVSNGMKYYEEPRR